MTALPGGVPILAVSFPPVLLVGSVVVLAVSTVLMSGSLSGISWPTRNRPTPARRHSTPFDASSAARNFLGGPIQATHRPLSNGATSAASRAPLRLPTTEAARQSGVSTDVHGSTGDVAEAIALLDELYEADPQRIVNVLMQLLNETKTENAAARDAGASSAARTGERRP